MEDQFQYVSQFVHWYEMYLKLEDMACSSYYNTEEVIRTFDLKHSLTVDGPPRLHGKA